MSLFKPAENRMAFAKVGLLGFAGSGKTRTAWEIAMGLHKSIKSKKPVAFMDTETGSDFILPFAKQAGIELVVSKTRAFINLIEGIKEAEKITDILIIDSVSHYWVDLVESYKKKKNVSRLAFQDWGVLKPEWNNFSTWYVTSCLHVIVCGRAGFEYDYFEGDEGKMELYKTGTKMKAEGEFGFEPSLLIEMERVKNPEATEEYQKARTKSDKEKAARGIRSDRQWVRRAWVLKDRADILDGKYFDNPTFKDFMPHWEHLNLGGEHKPIEPGDSKEMFDIEGKPEYVRERERIKIKLGEIEATLVLHYPTQDAASKKTKIQLLEECFGTRAWAKVESLKLAELEEGYSKLLNKLERKTQAEVQTQTPVDILADATFETLAEATRYNESICPDLRVEMDKLGWSVERRRDWLVSLGMVQPDRMTDGQVADCLAKLEALKAYDSTIEKDVPL